LSERQSGVKRGLSERQSGMERRIIARGVLAGAIGGVMAWLFARAFVEPAIGRAIDFEETHGGHDHGADLFTRGVQANIGMSFGLVAFAVAMGALFAVAFVVAYGRVGDVGPRALSIILAAGAFGAVTLVPSLKYPPNPPAVGHEETLHDRTWLYLLMVLLSLALAIAAVWLAGKLVAKFGDWSATLIASCMYLLAVRATMLVLPSVSETPDGFPADALYDFRVYSLGTQLVMWATIGVVFASLTGRLLSEQPTVGRAPSLTS
jgi:predicted cobalt transporter CbtA